MKPREELRAAVNKLAEKLELYLDEICDGKPVNEEGFTLRAGLDPDVVRALDALDLATSTLSRISFHLQSEAAWKDHASPEEPQP
jgi:hypothetical protein